MSKIFIKCFPNQKFLKLLMITKLLSFVLLIGAESLSAATTSRDNERILEMWNTHEDEVLRDIQMQSSLVSLYRADDVNDNHSNLSYGTSESVLAVFLSETVNESEFIEDISSVRKSTLVIETHSDQYQKRIKGKVTDSNGEPLPGATITILGTTKGVSTDLDGSFDIEVSPGEKLVFTFIGMDSQIIDVKDQDFINVTLLEKAEELDEVTVVAFARQKKESVLASIETVKPADLRIPSSNLTTALAGRMSGIISYQRSGEPGEDNAQFFIRGVTTFGYKKDPLILIDGIELSSTDLSNMHPDDIASFSIMKDATATALYGARGANGVILVTTKEGKEGAAKVSIRFENSISEPTKQLELADPITYMLLHNEAVRTRDPLGFIPYSPRKVENTINGTNPYYYPATDWMSEIIKDRTSNQRLNFNISGGGKVARYYLSGGVTQDNGILMVDDQNDFNSNINLKKYLIRSNININLSNTTEAVVRVHGTFDDYRGPMYGGAAMYEAILKTNPVRFPAVYPKNEEFQYAQHILFGNEGNGNWINPYAELVRGYKEYSKSLMLAQIELKQDLSFITEGLRARILGNTTRNSYFDVARSYNPFYYTARNYNNRDNTYSLSPLNSLEGREYLDYSEGQKAVASSFYAEGALQYDYTVNEKHGVSGLLVGIMRQSLIGNAGDLQQSLPYRNLGLSGRFTYSFDSRYFAEFNFGYNGTERFAEKERFGFFPSGGLGWYISNEKFFEPVKFIITKLKLKGTYGLVGNDQIGDAGDRFFYLSNVNLNNSDRGYTFGNNGQRTLTGVSISRYANDQITWETAAKTNIGIELGLWETIDINVDFFSEYRSNILWNRLSMSTFGLQAYTKANVGEASSRGIDFSMDINHFFANDFWIVGRVNFTYAKGIYEKVEEPDYSATPWLSRVGESIGQQWGFIAERLFVDDLEVANSPKQEFGSVVRGGDIKYRDINGDDKITDLDKVPIGKPVTPELIYGFGFSSGYKGFDFSVFMQGSGRSSFWIDANATSPFVNSGWSGGSGYLTNNALLKVYADSHWSESNRDVYAVWPRLSPGIEGNNTQLSTWFMRDGSFLRLKSLEIGYSIPRSFIDRYKLGQVRAYLSGNNLLYLSKFKLWDPEMGGNGLGYPIQRIMNFGIQVSF